MKVTLHIPLPALYILKQLTSHQFEAYLVGGAVRDLLLQARAKNQSLTQMDFDITTNAKPEQIMELFPESFYENDFGTVAISHQHLIEQIANQYPRLQPWLITNTQTTTPVDVVKLINPTQATKLHSSLQPTAAPVMAMDQTAAALPNFEITTYRSQELYSNFRKPDSLEWGTTLSEDLQRRDFTVNALALKISGAQLAHIFSTDDLPPVSPTIDLLPPDYELIDQFHGLEDLTQGVIKTVGEPNTRFQEDALRLLRAVRFSVQLNMQIEASTYASLKQNAALISKISWERISTEFLKILSSNYPAEGIELLDSAGLLDWILPELQVGKGVIQGGHHTTDVWTHSLDALRECPSSDPVVRLATLLHDVAKPQTCQTINGNITFYNHEIIGSRVARKIAQRLRLSKRDIDRVFLLVRYHMFYYQPENTDASIRRFMRKVGLENIDDILAVREGDRLGSGARKTSWRLEEMKQRMTEQLHQPMSVTDLVINGHDLMAEFGLKPGPLLGKILQQLFEMVLENPELNTREMLLEEAKTLVEQNL